MYDFAPDLIWISLNMRKILFSFLSVHFLTDSDSDLDNIIEEVDEDGSGTLDFDEFMEMMAG